jgi:hypothetical protein
VAYLIVKLKDGEEIEILGSIYPGEIARLKRTLDTKFGEAMIPPPQ